MMKSLMEYIGIEPGRYQTAWISGSEGPKFQEVHAKTLWMMLKGLGPNRKLRDVK
jgi:F420-non-reducing hydrogenase iron-sulfur subunit